MSGLVNDRTLLVLSVLALAMLAVRLSWGLYGPLWFEERPFTQEREREASRPSERRSWWRRVFGG